MGVHHSYAVQLIRKPTDAVLDRTEKVELEKICATFGEACEMAFKYGALKEYKRRPMPKIEGTRAVYPCKDNRFARVQIVIRST